MKPSDMSNVDRIAIEMGHAGRNTIQYIDEDRNSDRPFKLQTYRPYGYTPDRPVVIVQHGVLRNGDEYRDFWVEAADKHKLLIVALTFSNEIWPGVESYNNGRVFSAGGNPRHIDGWTYALVGNVIKDMIDGEFTDGQNVYLFGHSAGGQFVHRLMSSQSHAPFKAVAAGNPGCLLQIAKGLRARDAGIEVLHPVELLARATREGNGNTVGRRKKEGNGNTC